MSNTLAYYGTELIAAVKSFMLQVTDLYQMTQDLIKTQRAKNCTKKSFS
jgi:hypothetical protein